MAFLGTAHIEVDEPVAESDCFAYLSRTEKGTLTGSAGSRRDLCRRFGILGKGEASSKDKCHYCGHLWHGASLPNVLCRTWKLRSYESSAELFDFCPLKCRSGVSNKIHIRPSARKTEPTVETGNPEYLPNPILTPGSIVLENPQTILREGYADANRRVSQKEKDKVFRRYQILPKHRHRFQIDHLIPLSLGGSNDLRNLWPHPHHPLYGPVVKARLEAYLRSLVRRGIRPLQWAQNLLRENWVKAVQELCL